MAELIAEDRRERAIEECVAPQVQYQPGSGFGHGEELRNGFGYLLLDGLIVRRTGVEGRFGAELLGEGDLLRPWQDPYDSPALELEIGWTMLEPVRVAVLDEGFAKRVAEYPELGPGMVERAMRRARNLVVNMAIVHQARVDVRLHMLFWHLAGRWGRVRPEGTVLRMRLTHAVLADLVAARRPTVTTAIAELARAGLLRSSGDEWVLLKEAPGELTRLAGGTSPRVTR